MARQLVEDISFGRVQIADEESGVCVNIWNFMSGYHSLFYLNEFDHLLDFGLTLEYLFFLFSYKDDVRVVGFDSTKKRVFICVQQDEETWSVQHLAEVEVKVTQLERKVPGSWLTTDYNVTKSLIDKPALLAINLFKVHLVRNIGGFSTIQKIFESQSKLVKAPICSIKTAIMKVCTGNDFILLLTCEGHVLSMGVGSRGELGIDPMEAKSNLPRAIESLIEADIKVVDIACGGWHGLALTSDRDVYAWGLNNDGQCGLLADKASILEIPYPIDLTQPAKHVQAGAASTLIRLEDDSTVIYGRSRLE